MNHLCSTSGGSCLLLQCVKLYLPSGGMRMFRCPRWVSTLQAAELWGWVQGVRLATYMKWPRVCMGNMVARASFIFSAGARTSRGLACRWMPTHPAVF